MLGNLIFNRELIRENCHNQGKYVFAYKRIQCDWNVDANVEWNFPTLMSTLLLGAAAAAAVADAVVSDVHSIISFTLGPKFVRHF